MWKRLKYHIAVFFAVIGPGFITAVVDNDAGGIYTYSAAGAKYGYLPLWTLLPIMALLIVTQEMCSRMGAVTGKGLSDLIREEFGLRTTFFVMMALTVAAVRVIFGSGWGLMMLMVAIGYAIFGYIAAGSIVAAASGHRIRTGAAVHITDQDGARTRVSDPGANAHLVLAASAIAAIAFFSRTVPSWVAAATAGVTIDLSKQSDGFTILGSAYNDTITGSSGCIAFRCVSSSTPSISGMRMSVRTRSTLDSWNR